MHLQNAAFDRRGRLLSAPDPRSPRTSPARSRRSRRPARSPLATANPRCRFPITTTSNRSWAMPWTSAPDRRRGEERAQAPQARHQAQPGHLGHAHPADGERHHRSRMRLDHQQSRAAEAGLLHHHPFRHRQPLRVEEIRQSQDGRRSQGQDHRVDLGHHQHQADHRDRRAEGSQSQYPRRPRTMPRRS